jgi:hypothetical protein
MSQPEGQMKGKPRAKALLTIETIEGQFSKRAPRPSREQAAAERDRLAKMGPMAKGRPARSA